MLRHFIAIINKRHRIIAIVLLSIMFGLGLFSMRGDSAIVDEIAHIPAGYSYLKYGDFRLNPEHPPLIKDLAAMPLMLITLKFPSNIKAWTSDVNGQWEAGWHFIYHIGNDADTIIFWSRLPILLLSVVLGYVIYAFCVRRYGPQTALLALIFYAFSPTVIAHSRYVTTDLGIAAFTFFAFLAFTTFIERPSWKTAWWGGLFFALAQLAKFSAITLVPFFILLTLIAVWAKAKPRKFISLAKTYLGYLAALFVICGLVIWLFYIPHTINMPSVTQDSLIQGSLPSDGLYKSLGDFMINTNDTVILRSVYQYSLGLLMVFNRVSSGNITYFLGEVTNQSFAWYFPVSFIMKTQIPLLILIVLSIAASIGHMIRHWPKHFKKASKKFVSEHFIELSFALYIVFYSYISIKGNLNLGIRHLFPMLPMLFILVAKKVIDIRANLHHGKRTAYTTGVVILTLSYMITPILVYPRYVPYINAAFGGSGEAHRYLTDSNVDWGQDLKRLADWVKARPEIGKIAIDYFGGGEPKQMFCIRRYMPNGELITNINGYNCDMGQYLEWHAQMGIPPTEFIAVSETYLMNDLWTSGVVRNDPGYDWLRSKQPIAKIGDSIYIFRVR